MDWTEFSNRLQKNSSRLRAWARSRGLEAFRLYDLDVPAFPYSVDWYGGRLHVCAYPRRKAVRAGEADGLLGRAADLAGECLEVPRHLIFTKTHMPKVWGREQYRRVASGHEAFAVSERDLRFWVNLGDYLDTGLFLDHRNTRRLVRKEASSKSFLNLFAYTGSFTVAAAKGGALKSTTVDLSPRYLAWAKKNLELNGVATPQHELVAQNALEWVGRAREAERRYDLIFLDPPSYSSSKRMAQDFNVQRDHPALLEATLSLLEPGGTLLFSTHFKGFELAETIRRRWHPSEITPGTIPEDFRRRDVHRTWRFEKRS